MTIPPMTKAVKMASSGMLSVSTVRNRTWRKDGPEDRGTAGDIDSDMNTLLDAGHQQPQLLTCGCAGLQRVENVAFVHDGNAIGQAHNLVEFRADQQHGGAAIARLDNAAMNELDAADIQTASGLIDNQQLDRTSQFARHDDFLLIAAGE